MWLVLRIRCITHHAGLTSPLTDMAIGLASELLQCLFQLCIACLFRSLTVRGTAIVGQLQQTCDSLLIGLGLGNLGQHWHCKEQ